jgi:DNA-binding transcriptional ArsR family regulator
MDEPDSRRLDDVLRAVGDPTRRRILRLLRAQPGLTTNQLASQTPSMTRWGVMKHLAVLRDAGLVHSLEAGRQRRHYRDSTPMASLRRWLDEDADAVGTEAG